MFGGLGGLLGGLDRGLFGDLPKSYQSGYEPGNAYQQYLASPQAQAQMSQMMRNIGSGQQLSMHHFQGLANAIYGRGSIGGDVKPRDPYEGFSEDDRAFCESLDATISALGTLLGR